MYYVSKQLKFKKLKQIICIEKIDEIINHKYKYFFVETKKIIFFR